MAEENPAAQRQTAVTAHLESKQLLLFGFVDQRTGVSYIYTIIYATNSRLHELLMMLVCCHT